jgi:hypothetical protein
MAVRWYEVLAPFPFQLLCSFRMALRIRHSGGRLALPSKNSCSSAFGPGPIGYSTLERLINVLTFLTRFHPGVQQEDAGA